MCGSSPGTAAKLLLSPISAGALLKMSLSHEIKKKKKKLPSPLPQERRLLPTKDGPIEMPLHASPRHVPRIAHIQGCRPWSTSHATAGPGTLAGM